MGVTDDRNDPALKNIGPDGMQEKYLVLSADELARGFVRPVRASYTHVGPPPPTNLRDLTPEEQKQYSGYDYVKYEKYEDSESPVVGRFWTQKQLNNGCGQTTTMGLAIAETYARSPSFYGATFCTHCGDHFPVGAGGEFVWAGTDEKVGT